jgi:transcriptional regulator with XRE-family HTH domain
LAGLASISKRMVSSYESGAARPPVTILPALAAALRVSVDDLLRDTVEGRRGRGKKAARGQRKDGAAKKPAARVPEGFGARLAQLRRARGMTQQELGSLVGVSYRVIAYYEVQGGSPPTSLLPVLARTLGVTVDELLGARSSRAALAPKSATLWKRFKRVEELPLRKRQLVMRLIDEMITEVDGDTA